MKKLLLVLLIVIFIISAIAIESGCRETIESTTKEITTEPKIIFTSYRDINSEIYIMNTNGSEQINLTNHPADDYGACFSPDGSKIAFVSYRDGNSNGKNPVRLTYNDSDDTQPYWSQDGSKIAFKSNRDGHSNTYIMDSNGKNIIKLLGNKISSWSPDGSKLTFHKRDDNLEIYVMNIDGSGLIRLTDNSADDDNPFFSPDGSKIVFTSYRDGNQEIYIMNEDGSEQQRLTYNSASDYWGWDYGPHFSPDGSKILFLSHRDGRTSEIYIMNIDGSEQINLTNSPGYDINPEFSPDGSKIVFTSYRDGNQEEIYIMNVDGSEQTRLTDNIVRDTSPCFSPKGAMIFIEPDDRSKEEKDEDEICIEVSERSPRNVIEAELVAFDEDMLFDESDLIFKGSVIDEKEIGIEEYSTSGELHNIYFRDVFTFKINRIYYLNDSSLKNGGIVRVCNASCSNEWIEGTIEMKKGKEYIVLTRKSQDATVEFTKCHDFCVVQHWMAIISIENGDYIFDEVFTSLVSGAKEEKIREDGYFNTTMYIKGEEFEEEFKDLILEKKGGS